MPRQSILRFIKQLGRPIFTTYELSTISGKSSSATVQALNHLAKQGMVFKVYRNIWAEITDKPLNPYLVIPFLFLKNRAYVSFISALHLYGIIEQIPQVITLASTAHTKIVKTKIATYSIHRIAPLFFAGFAWYKDKGNFLIAQPEKALIDCLYLSAHKKKQFGYFPELHFDKSFSFKKAKAWVKRIPNPKTASYVRDKLEQIIKGQN